MAESLLRSLALLRHQLELWLCVLMVMGMLPGVLGYCVPTCECDTSDEGLHVDCSRRNFTELPVIPDELYGKIASLDLSDNALAALPTSPPRLSALRSLCLAGNALEFVPPRWFSRLRELRELDVSRNRRLPLYALGNGALVQARFLLLLNASHVDVEEDTEGAAAALSSGSLQIVDLSYRQLSEVRPPLLQGLTDLRSVDLSGNPLKQVRLSSPSLKELRVAHTKLDGIAPATLLDLPNLSTLDVSGNRGFSFLVSGGVLSESLTELRARHCEVRLESLKAFPNLRYANLQHNGVQSIMNASFDNAKIVDLDLSHNNIYRIHSHAFLRLPLLERINLAHNKIVEVHPEVFAANEYLVAVNLSNNLLADLGELRADNLAELDVSQCSIGSLSPHSLIKLPSLQILDLSSNRLERMPNNLTSSTLQVLNLSYCRLTSLTNDTFRKLPSLQVLTLSGNRFTEPLRKSDFASNLRLKSLLLRDNPWRCDCSSQDFHNFVEFMLTVDQEEVTLHARCASPVAAAGQTWLQACFDEWYPPPDERGPVRRFGAAMLAVVAVAGGALLLVSALRSSLRRRRKDRERRRHEEMERRLEEREHELRQQLRSEIDDDDDGLFRGSHARPRRTPSTITQPPTYEEALLLTHSQEDLLNSSRASPSGVTPSAAPASNTVAAAATFAVQAAVATGSGTCARHLVYEVVVEPAPKPKPPKPPRKTTKNSNGDRLSATFRNSLGNSSNNSSLSNLVERLQPSAEGSNSVVVHNAATFPHSTRDTGHTVGGIPESNEVITEEIPSTSAVTYPTAGASAAATATAAATALGPTVSAVSATVATTIANNSIPPPPYAPPPDSGGESETSSPLSTPAPRRQRPLSAYSSDASGEDSDDLKAPT